MEVMRQHSFTTHLAAFNTDFLGYNVAGQELTDAAADHHTWSITADLPSLPKPRYRGMQQGLSDAGCRCVRGAAVHDREEEPYPEARGGRTGAIALPRVQRVHVDASLPPDIPALQDAFNKTLTLWEHCFDGASAVSVILLHGHSMWVLALISLQTSLYHDHRHC